MSKTGPLSRSSIKRLSIAAVLPIALFVLSTTAFATDFKFFTTSAAARAECEAEFPDNGVGNASPQFCSSTAVGTRFTPLCPPTNEGFIWNGFRWIVFQVNLELVTQFIACSNGQCPAGTVASGTTCVPECPPGEVFNEVTQQCEAKCNLTLSRESGGAWEVEPGKTLTDLRATVLCNGQPEPGVPVALTAAVNANSGGHGHDDAGRPKGDLMPSSGLTDADGMLSFAFLAPGPAGDHTIIADCLGDHRCKKAEQNVSVGIQGLISLPGTSVYVLLPNADTAHPDNHYLTPTAALRMRILATFYDQFLTPLFPESDFRLRLNDASLVRGGIFDIRSNWTTPHHEHCRGAAIDIRANSAPGAIDSGLRKLFEGFARVVGSDPLWDIPKNAAGVPQFDLRHYHVRLMGEEGLECP